MPWASTHTLSKVSFLKGLKSIVYVGVDAHCHSDTFGIHTFKNDSFESVTFTIFIAIFFFHFLAHYVQLGLCYGSVK